jgi:hypothetical protein
VHDSRGNVVKRLIPAHAGCPAVNLLPGLYGRVGQQLDVLVPNGCALTSWDGTDTRGRRARDGIYILVLRTAGGTSSQRFIFDPN